MKKAKPISLSFRLRARYKTGQQSLQIRLRVAGQVASDYDSGVSIPADYWVPREQGLQADHPQAAEIADTLATIRNEHIKIYQQQLALTRIDGYSHIKVTAERVKRQWLAKDDPQPIGTLLTDIYDDLLKYLKSLPKEEKKADRTMQRYRLAGQLLREYLAERKTPKLTAEQLTTGWARQYFDWLRAKDMSRDTAAKYVGHLRHALQHALEYDVIPKNPIYEFRPKRDKVKRVVYLTQEQLTQLEQMDLSGTADVARKWALLSCHTGLDYLDAVEVAKRYDQYRVEVLNGGTIRSKIIYQRLKMAHAPQWGECHIPVLPEAETLLSEAAGWKKLTINSINRYLHVFQDLLKLPFEFTTKVCRKSAGALFLRKEFPVEVVQKILGHQSYKTTERHYLSMPGEVVDQHIQRLNKGSRVCKPQPLQFQLKRLE